METVTVTFQTKDGVTKEELVQSLMDLTFEEDLSILGEQVESITDLNGVVHLNH